MTENPPAWNGPEGQLSIAERMARVGLSVLYGMMTLWGFLAGIYGISVLTTSFDFLAPLWYTVAGVSLVALLALLFNRQSIEAWTIVVWLFVATMYPTTLALRYLLNDGAPASHSIVLAVTPLLFPITRLTYLISRNRWKLPSIHGETREQRDQ